MASIFPWTFEQFELIHRVAHRAQVPQLIDREPCASKALNSAARTRISDAALTFVLAVSYRVLDLTLDVMTSLQ